MPLVILLALTLLGMHWRGRTVGVDARIPRGLAQHHWSPAVGDRLTAWRGLHPGEAFDGNLYPAAGEIWFLHWLIPTLCGYRWITDPHTRRRRRMTIRELHRPATRWSAAGIKTWTDKHGQHPMTALEGYTWAAEHGHVIAGEPKGPAWAHDPAWFRRLRAVFDATGHPAWVKRIATLRFPKAVVRNAHAARVQVAAIYGKGVKGRARRLRATARWKRRGVQFDATW